MHELWIREANRPANFQDNYYIYVPNLPAAIVALVLWFAIFVAIMYRSWRYKIWYLTVLMVGLLSKRLLSSAADCSGNDWIYHESLWTFPFECL